MGPLQQCPGYRSRGELTLQKSPFGFDLVHHRVHYTTKMNCQWISRLPQPGVLVGCLMSGNAARVVLANGCCRAFDRHGTPSQVAGGISGRCCSDTQAPAPSSMRRDGDPRWFLSKVSPSTLNSGNCYSSFVAGRCDRDDVWAIRCSVPVGMNPPAPHRERMTQAVFPVGVSAGFALLLGIETYPMAFGRGVGESGGGGGSQPGGTGNHDGCAAPCGLPLHRRCHLGS